MWILVSIFISLYFLQSLIVFITAVQPPSPQVRLLPYSSVLGMSTSSATFRKAIAVVAKQQNNPINTSAGSDEVPVTSTSKGKKKTSAGKPIHFILVLIILLGLIS